MFPNWTGPNIFLPKAEKKWLREVMQSGVFISKGSKEQRACVQIFSIQTSKLGFLFSCVSALVHMCAFKYKTFPTSV